MPRPAKPARLWLEPERRDATGRVTHAATWIILDGGKHRTGCRADDIRGAQAALEAYLAQKHADAPPTLGKPADATLIADALARYAKEASGTVRRPGEMLARLERLLDWWGNRTFGHVNRLTCKEYTAARGSRSAARRELEDLRAAINLSIADGLCREAVKVTLPQKHKSRAEYFTRSNVAALIWHCLKTREEQTVHKGPLKGQKIKTKKRPLRHLVPFILTAVYTGTRASRISSASFVREADRPWIDLDSGLFHRLPDTEQEPENKRAGTVRIPERLLRHMRLWRRSGTLPTAEGRREQRYLCEYHGRPADSKRALADAMDAVFGSDHPFVRHTFRHTCATWLMWAGEDLNDVAAYLSMTREMVERVYGHHHPDAHAAIGDAFTSGKAGRRVGRTNREQSQTPRTIAKETPGITGNNGSTEAA